MTLRLSITLSKTLTKSISHDNLHDMSISTLIPQEIRTVSEAAQFIVEDACPAFMDRFLKLAEEEFDKENNNYKNKPLNVVKLCYGPDRESVVSLDENDCEDTAEDESSLRTGVVYIGLSQRLSGAQLKPTDQIHLLVSQDDPISVEGYLHSWPFFMSHKARKIKRRVSSTSENQKTINKRNNNNTDSAQNVESAIHNTSSHSPMKEVNTTTLTDKGTVNTLIAKSGASFKPKLNKITNLEETSMENSNTPKTEKLSRGKGKSIQSFDQTLMPTVEPMGRHNINVVATPVKLGSNQGKELGRKKRGKKSKTITGGKNSATRPQRNIATDKTEQKEQDFVPIEMAAFHRFTEKLNDVDDIDTRSVITIQTMEPKSIDTIATSDVVPKISPRSMDAISSGPNKKNAVILSPVDGKGSHRTTLRWLQDSCKAEGLPLSESREDMINSLAYKEQVLQKMNHVPAKTVKSMMNISRVELIGYYNLICSGSFKNVTTASKPKYFYADKVLEALENDENHLLAAVQMAINPGILEKSMPFNNKKCPRKPRKSSLTTSEEVKKPKATPLKRKRSSTGSLPVPLRYTSSVTPKVPAMKKPKSEAKVKRRQSNLFLKRNAKDINEGGLLGALAGVC